MQGLEVNCHLSSLQISGNNRCTLSSGIIEAFICSRVMAVRFGNGMLLSPTPTAHLVTRLRSRASKRGAAISREVATTEAAQRDL
jgi:hypothetical protein